ncbi:MAG: hypothetical protein IT370_07690 [Deltaproteobacteria bacterium]|nr:hypothetical protein [Deltaproteobacteria bacterium]
MDALRRDDIERAISTPPAERLLRTLELMDVGIEMQRESLKRRHPEESEPQIEQRLRAWLLARD